MTEYQMYDAIRPLLLLDTFLPAVAENENLYKTDKKQFRKKFKDLAKQINFPYDARAIAQEFGSAHNPAHPYLRPALESQAQTTVDRLSVILARRIEQFRAKMK
jgi:hypothetical protein